MAPTTREASRSGKPKGLQIRLSNIRRLGAKSHPPQCPVMAISGCSGHAAGPTALPLKADLQAAMSASPPISSASPPGADVPGDARVGPLVTQGRPLTPLLALPALVRLLCQNGLGS